MGKISTLEYNCLVCGDIKINIEIVSGFDDQEKYKKFIENLMNIMCSCQ